MSELKQYQVGKQVRFMSSGFLCTVKKGTIVTDRTHDLNLLRRQGANLKEVQGVEVYKDQMGIDRTRTIEKGKDGTDKSKARQGGQAPKQSGSQADGQAKPNESNTSPGKEEGKEKDTDSPKTSGQSKEKDVKKDPKKSNK